MRTQEAVVMGEHTGGRVATFLRTIGAIAVLVVGAVHLQQYLSFHFNSVRIIGPLFLLNFAGATVIGLGLLVPLAAEAVAVVALATYLAARARSRA